MVPGRCRFSATREATCGFMRASPLRFNLIGSVWRTCRIEDSVSLQVDPYPEILVGECGAEPLARVPWSPSRVYSEVAGRQ
jgi:hypothetical protein